MCECLAVSPERLSRQRLVYAAPYSLFFAAKQGLEDACAAGDAGQTAFEPASASVSAGRTAFGLDFAPVRRASSACARPAGGISLNRIPETNPSFSGSRSDDVGIALVIPRCSVSASRNRLDAEYIFSIINVSAKINTDLPKRYMHSAGKKAFLYEKTSIGQATVSFADIGLHKVRRTADGLTR